MTIFYLLRHGAKEKVMGDPPLSEVGREQAKATGEFFKKLKVQSIFSSPMQRTKQTAEIVSSFLNLEIKADERLKERINWGDRDKETFEEFLQEWYKGDLDRNYKPKNGDSSFATGERLKEFFTEISKNHKGSSALVVTHGGAIGDFLKNYFKDLNLVRSLGGGTYVEILECSITTIVLENDKFELKKVGDISHLPEILI